MRGVYVLVVSIDEPASLKVGRLGRLSFKKGLYAYVGSGQVGLRARVARHLRRNKKRFWHIDYLLGSGVGSVVRVFWKEGGRIKTFAVDCHIKQNQIFQSCPGNFPDLLVPLLSRKIFKGFVPVFAFCCAVMLELEP